MPSPTASPPILVTMAGDSPSRAAAVSALPQLPPPWREWWGVAGGRLLGRARSLQGDTSWLEGSADRQLLQARPLGLLSTHLHLKLLGAQLVVWLGEGRHLCQQVLAAAAHAHHAHARRQRLRAALQEGSAGVLRM